MSHYNTPQGVSSLYSSVTLRAACRPRCPGFTPDLKSRLQKTGSMSTTGSSKKEGWQEPGIGHV